MKKGILRMLEQDAVPGSRQRAAAAKGGVSCEERRRRSEGESREGARGRGGEIAVAGGDVHW